MEVEVLDINGKNTGEKAELPDSIFGIEPNEHSVYLDVKLIRARQRSGTHKAKERNEVNRTTKKLKKQKGTGGARAGSMRSPIFRGGGTIFGPKPRDYSFKLNKKTRRLARKSVLSSKASDNAIKVISDFSFDQPKTKNYLSFLKALELDSKKTLLVTEENDKNILLASRNLKNANVITADRINTYDLLNTDNILFSVSGLRKLKDYLN